MSQPTLVCLGSVNMDFVVRTERWPEQGETLFGRDYVRAAGGKAANRAFIGRRLGADVRLLAHVGDDDLSKQVISELEQAGIDTEQVTRSPGLSTGLAMIFVASGGEKTIILAPNANLSWPDDRVHEVEAVVKNAPAGSVLALDLEISPAVVARAARAARDRGLNVVIDPVSARRS